ncbi:hypothetical protein PYCC9005_003756 [Savitreella phatthalungensis]
MPYPRNLEMAKEVENVVRRNGATPATIALLEGRPHVGLNDASLELLAREGMSARKVSRRDMAACVADKATGGTTVSGTMILAKQAGIKVFVTGGIGGVHRNGHVTFDISNDLNELSRNDVAVICAGPKAILDIPRTLEYLETMGVAVTTVGGQKNLPAFYSRDSGLPSPRTSPTPEHAARLIHANRSLGLGSSTLVCVPCPTDAALGKAFMDRVIEMALSDAESQGVGGKDTTPFLLQAVSEATEGKSLAANIALVMENARVGAQIAVELAKLERNHDPQESEESEVLERDASARVAKELMSLEDGSAINAVDFNGANFWSGVDMMTDGEDLRRTADQHCDIAVVGSTAIDLTYTVDSDVSAAADLLQTSCKGEGKRSLGGVAANIARASAYSGSRTALVSAIGTDAEGDSTMQIISNLSDKLDTSHIYRSQAQRTTTYCCIQMRGELVLAVADMDLIENIDPSRINRSLNALKPAWVACDANLSPVALQAALSAARDVEAKVLFEPVSVTKAGRIFDSAVKLQCWPNHDITCMTPNIHELKALYDAAKRRADVDSALAQGWWQVVDALGIDSNFRNICEHFFSRHRTDLTSQIDLEKLGAIQQCIHLLPYSPCIFLTLGRVGVLSVRLHDASEDTASQTPLSGQDEHTIVWRHPSSTMKGTGLLQPVLTVQYHPVTTVLNSDEVKSDTGAGDTFAGALLTALHTGQSIDQAVAFAQACSIETLKTHESVARTLRTLNVV